MKKGKKLMALLLAAVAAVSMAACGGDSGKKNENVDYNIMGNYVYQNEDGGNTDADGAEWYLFIDSETKFHLVGIKKYDNAIQSIRIDEGQIVSVSGYQIDCGFTPYSMFTQYIHHGVSDEATLETVKSITQQAVSDYQDKTGDEFFQIQLDRTSNDMQSSGTFSVLGDITLGWGAWQ